MFTREAAEIRAFNEVYQGDPVTNVRLEGYLECLGYGGMDDIWDRDGHSIQARPWEQYKYDGTPVVEVQFPQGTDAKTVASILQKMAAMLAGPGGSKLANLGLVIDRFDIAKRDEDGTVVIGNYGPNRDAAG